MTSIDRRGWISIALNSLLVAGAVRNLQITGALSTPSLLQYYTELSNLAAGLMALVLIVCTLRGHVPRAVQLVKWMTVCALGLTFVVVALLLGPESGSVEGFIGMFTGPSVRYSHLANPLIAILAWVTVDANATVRRRDISWALAPTVVYAIVMAILNVTGHVHGPYFFLEVTRQPIWTSAFWTVVVLGLHAVIAWALVSAAKRLSRRHQRTV